MQIISTILVYLAALGAIVSWIAGAVFYARTLKTIAAHGGSNWLAVIVWPFATSRLKGAGAHEAAKVNKALVAFITCVIVGIAALSVSTNLHRYAK